MTLPSTLSGLIRLGLDCLEGVSTMPETYVIDMDQWHLAPKKSKKQPIQPPTRVCLAGCVMALILAADPTQELTPSDLDTGEVWGKLRALNWAQGGWVRNAGEAMGLKVEGFDRSLVEYKKDAAVFRSEMLRLAEELEAVGL